MSNPNNKSEDALYQRVSRIIKAGRSQVSRSVNTAMVHAYWLIGREIVEVEQEGKERAGYGEQVLRRLADRLSVRFGRGFSYPNIKRMRQFYLTFRCGTSVPPDLGGPRTGASLQYILPASEKGSTVSSLSTLAGTGSAPLGQFIGDNPFFPPMLSWSHYVLVMRVEDPTARSFYEIEAAREGWSVRELERQIASLLYERLAKSRDKDNVMALAKEGQKVTRPADVIKDPMVLEFLELEERASWRERDLEQAIIGRLEAFLLEMGKGFCFVARQKRITLDRDHFYVDLVFYNRLLRCFVLVDLKLGKLTHKDLGQMQMYVNYFDRFQRAEWELPSVGIVLCSEKNEAMVRITLPEDSDRVYASRYQLYLPTEEQLRGEVIEERERIEKVRSLAFGTDLDRGPGDG